MAGKARDRFCAHDRFAANRQLIKKLPFLNQSLFPDGILLRSHAGVFIIAAD